MGKMEFWICYYLSGEGRREDFCRVLWGQEGVVSRGLICDKGEEVDQEWGRIFTPFSGGHDDDGLGVYGMAGIGRVGSDRYSLSPLLSTYPSGGSMGF